MSSLRKHPASPFWSACFAVHVPNAFSERWNRSLKTSDRKLAISIADQLEEAGRGVLSEEAIISFTDKIRDVRTRNAVLAVFKDVSHAVTGREFGAGSLRSPNVALITTRQTRDPFGALATNTSSVWPRLKTSRAPR